MRLAEHPYLFGYLVGVVLAMALLIAKSVVFWSLCWITKTNILAANVKKLREPDKTPIRVKIAKAVGWFVAEAALSWLNVALVLWQILADSLRTIRDALSATPETVKRLRFPLKNNPDLSAEAVWAYLFALDITAGAQPPDEPQLMIALSKVSAHHPSFDQMVALGQLEFLGVVKPDVLSAAVDIVAEERNHQSDSG